jgi:hypothetical protein
MKGTLWRCPKCKREFVKRSQSHSCALASVDSHFASK